MEHKLVKTEPKKIPPTAKDVFAELDNWKTNIRNLATCLDKFNMDKYNNDIKRQSLKFIARLKDVFEGILEHGDEYDFSIIKASVNTELKMLEFDRNKIFMLLMEFCSNIVHAGNGKLKYYLA